MTLYLCLLLFYWYNINLKSYLFYLCVIYLFLFDKPQTDLQYISFQCSGEQNVFPINHGRLARWRKWKSCDVGEAKEGLENELWRR